MQIAFVFGKKDQRCLAGARVVETSLAILLQEAAATWTPYDSRGTPT